jgi:hypothetical protein
MPITSNAGVYRVGTQYGVLRYQQTAIDIDQLAKDLGATYNWSGETLPSVESATGNWIDTINGTVATATGSPTVTTLNGRKAALFEGAQSFSNIGGVTVDVNTTYAAVFVYGAGVTLGAVWSYFTTGAFMTAYRLSSGNQRWNHRIGASEISGGSFDVAGATTGAAVGVVLRDGSTWTQQRNAVTATTTASIPAATMTTLRIGEDQLAGAKFVGPIARVTVFPNPANAAVFAAACQVHYRI